MLPEGHMSWRRSAAAIGAVVAIAVAIAIWWLPEIVRHAAIARIHAMTGRATAIDGVDLSVLSGRFTVRGVRLAERDGTSTFARIERIDGRLHLPSMLAGHVRLRELIVNEPSVQIVRRADREFNISDLQRSSGGAQKTFDLTVERFQVVRGRATLEDRVGPEVRTWASEDMTIDAHDLSTRRADGRATGSSRTAGARTSFEIRNLRLHPISLEGTVNVAGLDLTLVQVYMPAGAPVRIERGRMSSTISIVLDAREGIRADASGRASDVVVARTDDGRVVARVAEATTRVMGLGLRDADVRVGRLALDGRVEVQDPSTRAERFHPSDVRASIVDLTWPATTPGRLDLHASIPGGGTMTLAGTVQAPPAPSDLRLQIARANLASWAQFVPGTLKIAGLVKADLRMNAPFGPGLASGVDGSVAATGLTIANGPQELARVDRVAAHGFEVHWPDRVAIGRVELVGPRTTVVRDADGRLHNPLASAGTAPASTPTPTSRASNATTPRTSLTVGEIAIRHGAFAWRDASTQPDARLDVGAVDMRIAGASWPLTGHVEVRGGFRPPGGGHVKVAGRVGVENLDADLRVQATNAALSPYQPYLPTTARLSGAADFDLAVTTPSLTARRAAARGSATIFRLDVRDGQRTVVRTERARVSGLDVEWPGRTAAAAVALSRPWILLERDETGALGLRHLAPKRSSAGATAANPSTVASAAEETATTSTVRIGRLTIDDGGLRVVDRAIRPAFAVDLDRAAVRIDGLATGDARPARIEMTARVGATADLALRGTVGPLDGPLRLDLDGELREFTVPRMNSYLVRQVGWSSRAGEITTKLRGRVDGDALAAKTDISITRLQLVRAGEHDEAQNRVGLPLGLITTLMKNRRGEITLSFPIGGHLADPKFDVREALWGAVRTVAINAITLPVSWIGRVEFTRDSKIQKIHVDPLPFEPGTATLTAEGRTQVGRLKSFMDELPEVRLQLTPVVSTADLAELKRRRVLAAVDDLARTERLTREAAILRLYEQRLHHGAERERHDAALAALVEREDPGERAIAELADGRRDAARSALKHAGVDSERVLASRGAPPVGPESRVAIDIVEPEGPRSSKLRDALKKLGLPVGDRNASD
jgi:uncharacterized protein involved in outer membrane biogenesis